MNRGTLVDLPSDCSLACHELSRISPIIYPRERIRTPSRPFPWDRLGVP